MNGRGTRTSRKLTGRNQRMTKTRISLCAFALILGMANISHAQDRGPVTNLPLPRFVSMKANEGNVRRGPSRTHRIDWIFQRKDVPLEITAEHGHWRRIRDRDGAGGWMHYSLLSGVRTAIIETDMLEMKANPEPASMVVAQLELGVIARIEECHVEWCKLSTAGYKGWVRKETLWGVGPGETLD